MLLAAVYIGRPRSVRNRSTHSARALLERPRLFISSAAQPAPPAGLSVSLSLRNDTCWHQDTGENGDCGTPVTTASRSDLVHRIASLLRSPNTARRALHPLRPLPRCPLHTLESACHSSSSNNGGLSELAQPSAWAATALKASRRSIRARYRRPPVGARLVPLRRRQRPRRCASHFPLPSSAASTPSSASPCSWTSARSAGPCSGASSRRR